MTTTPIDGLPDSAAPPTLDEVLSPAWLSRVLSSRWPGAQVASVSVVEKLQTVATKVRFAVTFRDAAAAGDAPTAMCMKGYFNPERRGMRTEVDFYRELAPALPIRVPDCIYAGADDDTGQAIIIMRDLVASGHTFLTALSPYSPEQASRTLDQIALLHSVQWGTAGTLSPQLWLAPRMASAINWVTRDQLAAHMTDPRGEHLPESVKDADRIRASVGVAFAAVERFPATLVHGDAHAGNLYENAAGEPGIIDWQVVMRSAWCMDVAYHVGAALTVDQREKSEQDLLRHYLDRLRAYGIAAPGWDDAWLGYKQSLAYGYFMWAITRMVDRPIINEFTNRLGHAVAHHGSFELLGV